MMNDSVCMMLRPQLIFFLDSEIFLVNSHVHIELTEFDTFVLTRFE